MISMGLCVALGLIVMFCKLSWRKRLWCLSHPLALDISVFTLVSVLHWGTFSGMMVAAVAALACSMCISTGRWLFGYIKAGRYFPGRINILDKIGG
jgi:hypothetical protein